MVLRNMAAARRLLVDETNGGGATKKQPAQKRRTAASKGLTITEWRELAKELEGKLLAAETRGKDRALAVFDLTASLSSVRDDLRSYIDAHRAALPTTLLDELETILLVKLEIPKPVVCGFSSAREIFEGFVNDAFNLIRDKRDSGDDIAEADLKDIVMEALGTVQTSLFYSSSEEVALARDLMEKSDEKAGDAVRTMMNYKLRAERAERQASNVDAVVACIGFDSLTTLAETITFATVEAGAGKLSDLVSVRGRGLRAIQRQLVSVNSVLSDGGGGAVLRRPLLSVAKKPPSANEISAEVARRREQVKTVKAYAALLTKEESRLKAEEARLEKQKRMKARKTIIYF